MQEALDEILAAVAQIEADNGAQGDLSQGNISLHPGLAEIDPDSNLGGANSDLLMIIMLQHPNCSLETSPQPLKMFLGHFGGQIVSDPKIEIWPIVYLSAR